MDKLLKEYTELLSEPDFDGANMDYTLLETFHKPVLMQLAKVSNSVITIFDLHLRKHVFTSSGFFDLFGSDADIEGMDKKIHLDDLQFLIKNAITALKYVYSHKEYIKNYKFIVEYRICNASGEYVRVIEQQSVLESDSAGNAWLALSVIDLSPNQSPLKSVRSGIFNKKDNSFVPIQNLCEKNTSALSPRELEILQMVKDGLLSKEISDQLSISVHTVNTHRQRILEKLNADNSMEAVKYASEQGLID
jgi:DNA-binding CsgD family transcriptional regulator